MHCIYILSEYAFAGLCVPYPCSLCAAGLLIKVKDNHCLVGW